MCAGLKAEENEEALKGEIENARRRAGDKYSLDRLNVFFFQNIISGCPRRYPVAIINSAVAFLPNFCFLREVTQLPWAAGESLMSQGLGFLGISSRCQRAE